MRIYRLDTPELSVTQLEVRCEGQLTDKEIVFLAIKELEKWWEDNVE